MTVIELADLHQRVVALEARQAVIETAVYRLQSSVGEIIGDIHTLQGQIKIGFAAVSDKLKEQTDVLELLRQKAMTP